MAEEALSTTNRVEFINKKEFAKATLNKNSETFVIHVVVLKIPSRMTIYPFRAVQVPTLQSAIQLATL